MSRLRHWVRRLRDLGENARRIGPTQVILTLAYGPRLAWYRARFPTHPGRPACVRPPLAAAFHLLRDRFPAMTRPTPQPVGDLQTVTKLAQGLALTCTAGYLTLEALGEHHLRLRMVRQPPMPAYFSYATLPVSTSAAVELVEEDDALELRTAALRVRIRRHPLQLDIHTATGEPLIPRLTLGWEGAMPWLEHGLPAGLEGYGLGERAFPLALRGRRYSLITRDPETYRPGDDPLYINIPFLVTVHKGRACGLFFDSSYRSELDLGHTQPDRLRYHTTGPELRLDFLLGPDLPGLLERYTALTGRMNLPPRWTLGYHQSRWSYETAAIVRRVATEFRRRQLPCDAIHLDIDYMDGFRCFTWNPQTFPDPAGLIAELHRQGFHVVAMVDPGIKVDPNYAVCADGIRQDCFLKLPDGRLFHGPVWPGECYFPDFTNPRVRAWWGEWYRGLLDVGVDGFWNDMNEPTIFGQRTFPAAVQYHVEGYGGDHRQAQSVYGLQMVRASFEGLNRLRPDRRHWVFSRSGYAGLQRYGSSWTGDNTSDWPDLALTPAMLLNLGLSGLSFTGCDIGGFAGAPTPELFARWFSMAAFTPFFRTHAAKNTPWREPWVFGPEVEAIARRYLNLRMRLLPYLYTAFWQCATRGTPIMRPLLWEDAAHPAYRSRDDQWLLGDHLLVSPVLTPATDRRELMLPAGHWYDFWDDTPVAGGTTIVRTAPLDTVPLHVRAGAVLPLGPVQQYTAELPHPPLEFHLYPPSAAAETTVSWLYNDDGETLAYRRGAYSLTRLELRRDGDRLVLTRKHEGDPDLAGPAPTVVLHGAYAAAVALDGADQGLSGASLALPTAHWHRLEMLLAQE